MIKDIAGQRFGHLTAIRPSEERQHGHVVWECRCDCGNTVFLRRGRLIEGSSISCGCLKNTNALDITGQKFNRLTAIRPTDKRSGRSVVWECKCECGATTYVSVGSLKSGSTKSCGCTWKERGKDLAGMKFGRLTAIRATEKREGKYVVWECLCACGKTTFVRSGSLLNGNTQSCGCLWVDAVSSKK